MSILTDSSIPIKRMNRGKNEQPAPLSYVFAYFGYSPIGIMCVLHHKVVIRRAFSSHAGRYYYCKRRIGELESSCLHVINPI